MCTWVAQSVEHWTLDLGSGLDLTIVGLSPVLGSILGMEPTLKKVQKLFVEFHVQSKYVEFE